MTTTAKDLKVLEAPKNKFPKGPVGPQYTKKIMPWVEQFWHNNKRYPNVVEFAQKFGLTADQYNLLSQSKFWLLALDRRGIARPTIDINELSDRQIAAIAVLTNFGDRRDPVARLQSLGVTEEELHGWRSNPAFKRELETRANDIMENVAPDATVELAKAIKRGYFPAIKFYFEVTGQASSPELINLKQSIQILIEAVQKHVKDPAVLEAIANEVQSIRSIGSVE